MAFDGMRKHLADDFDAIYILDLGGNVRKNPKSQGQHECFRDSGRGEHQPFVSRNKEDRSETPEIFYARVDEFWKGGENRNLIQIQCQNIQTGRR